MSSHSDTDSYAETIQINESHGCDYPNASCSFCEPNDTGRTLSHRSAAGLTNQELLAELRIRLIAGELESLSLYAVGPRTARR